MQRPTIMYFVISKGTEILMTAVGRERERERERGNGVNRDRRWRE